MIFVDTDECADPYACDFDAQCVNMPGTYECTCNSGFSGDGKVCLGKKIWAK